MSRPYSLGSLTFFRSSSAWAFTWATWHPRAKRVLGGGEGERGEKEERERERARERERDTHTHTHKPQKQTFDYTAIFSRIN